QIPSSMLIAAGGTPNDAVTLGRGGAGGPGADGGPVMMAGTPEEMRQRFANMSEEERAAMRERFQNGGGFQGGGRPGGPGGGNFQGGNFQAGADGGSADSGSGPFAQEAQPSYVTDIDAPPRPQTVLVMVNGAPQARDIMVGLVSRTEAEVISGLEAGETIVLGEAAQAGSGGSSNNSNFRGPPGGFRPF